VDTGASSLTIAPDKVTPYFNFCGFQYHSHLWNEKSPRAPKKTKKIHNKQFDFLRLLTSFWLSGRNLFILRFCFSHSELRVQAMELGMHVFGEVYVTGAEGEVSWNFIVFFSLPVGLMWVAKLMVFFSPLKSAACVFHTWFLFYLCWVYLCYYKLKKVVAWCLSCSRKDSSNSCLLMSQVRTRFCRAKSFQLGPLKISAPLFMEVVPPITGTFQWLLLVGWLSLFLKCCISCLLISITIWHSALLLQHGPLA
jgi:hypothetical protein